MRRIRIDNPIRSGRWWRVPLVLAAWLAIAAPVVVLAWGYSTLRRYAADLPEVPDLEAWERSVPRTSRIVAADGTLVAEIPFRSDDGTSGHRAPVDYAAIPARMVEALLAAEDVRFFSHHGVDFTAVARAAWANYRAGVIVEGASTLTQQVARNLLPSAIGNERSLARKLREALLARRIERRYPKQRILEVYANHVFLGASAYGIAAAARAYFSRQLGELSLAETAMIAGLAQAPGRADPYRDPEAARARRDQVLDRMLRAGFIAPAAHADAIRQPIALRPPPTAYGSVAPWHTERARREVAEAWPEAYARGGLVIETSAEPTLSWRSERAARGRAAALAAGDAPPQVGALIWDLATGYVEATVGGLAWEDSQFDRALQACRQPGSAFKPLVYAAALEHGVITPGTPLRDAPIAEWDEDLEVHWKPTNSGRAFRGVALAQDALTQSLNAPAVAVLDSVGARNVIGLARRLDITSELSPVRPLALGASCVAPIELAGAFAALARGGVTLEPVFVTRVTGPDGLLLDRASPRAAGLRLGRRIDRLAAAVVAAPERAVDELTAFQTTAMLVDVVERGTGRDATRLGRPAAGKTGTTNDNTDAWFVGFDARVIAAVWIGHDEPSRGLGRGNDGAGAALPLWLALMRAAEDGRPVHAVQGPAPAALVRVRVDRETGLLARPGAGGAIDLYFRPGTEPTARAGQIEGVSPDLGRVGRGF
jgi:penicillin-binding protein 1A